MAETVRIEIPIETVDQTEPELSKVVQNFKKLETAANNANNSAKKASSTVSQFDKNAEKTQKSLATWAKEKYEILLEAKDRISPILTTIGGGLRSFASKTWNITMKAIDLVTAPVRGIINLLKNPIFQVGAVLGVSIGLKDTIETYKNFEAAMSQVQAISGATGSQLDQLTAKAKEMGSTTKFTATESAEAFNYMAMAGWQTEDMLNGIEGILSLAAASGEDLATTSDIVTDALTAFKLSAQDAGHFSDVLAAAASNANTTVSGMGETFKYAGSMAGSLGYSIEDVALMTGLMANAGVKSTMAGTALNSIFTRLSTNTNGAADALEGLGIAFYDEKGYANDLSDIMDQLRIKTADMNDEQRSQLANTIAGTQAQKGLLAILNASEEDYNKLADAINNADGAAKGMSETMMDNLQGSITLLQSAVDGVKISFGERLSPYVRSLADWLTAQMPAIERGLDEFMDWFDVKADNFKRKLDEITSTTEWQNADFFGKVHIAWDEFIAEPFKEWWESSGKSKMADIAGDMGHVIGGAFKVGILTLLGIDISETINEGASIGAQFAQGFSEGFDFDLISSKLTEGLGNIVKNAFKLLPGGESADISSLLSAALLMKIASPMVSMGKGAVNIGKTLFGTNAATGTSLMGGLLGSAAMGTGLLGKSAMLAIDLGAGNLAGGASLGAGTLAGLGMGAVAGGAIGGATLISGGIDLYKAIKSTDKAESAAYGESAAWKAGGVAAGAAAGAALGSVIPGLGTAVGALIGAGVGGIAGWIKGNKVKEEYQENVEEMQKKAEKIQAVYAATGQSIEDVKFANAALADAINDTELSAEDFARFFQESCLQVMEEGFGDVKLSLTEIKQIADDLVFNGMREGLEQFNDAARQTQSSLASLNSSANNLKKQNWKVSLGLTLSETEKNEYKSSIDNFIESAQQYIEDNHYEATVALNLLTGGKGSTAGLDAMYSGMKEQIDSIAEQLRSSMEISLEDGIITLDEAKEIENLQNQIAEITGKIMDARNEASLQSLKVKYTSGAELDYASYQQLQTELKARMAEIEQSYDDALELTLTSLNLELAEGAITQEDYDAAVKEATEGYRANMDSINVRVQDFNLETISEAFSTQLNGILPNLEGDLKSRLEQAMEAALLINPDPASWSQEDIVSWFNLEGLTAEMQANMGSMLKDTASLVPQTTKDEIVEAYVASIPTAEEIKAAIDWDSMTINDWDALMESITGPIEGPSFSVPAEDAAKPMAEYYGEYFESVKESYSQALANALENAKSDETVQTFMDTYMTNMETAVQTATVPTFDEVFAQLGPISNEYYESLLAEWTTAGTNMGNNLNTGVNGSLMLGGPLYRLQIQNALNTATTSPFSISPTVNVTPNYNISSLPVIPQASGHAAGGYVGSKQLSWLAEEGYGEYVIPTNPSRRDRALELYEQAGRALGVDKHAEGGYVGGAFDPYSVKNSDNLNSFNDDVTNAPRAYSDVSDTYYEPVPTASNSGNNSNESTSGASIQVSVNMNPEFNISGSDTQSEDDIMAVLRRHMNEIADELGGNIAGKLEEVFSNMPLATEG